MATTSWRLESWAAANSLSARARIFGSANTCSSLMRAGSTSPGLIVPFSTALRNEAIQTGRANSVSAAVLRICGLMLGQASMTTSAMAGCSKRARVSRAAVCTASGWRNVSRSLNSGRTLAKLSQAQGANGGDALGQRLAVVGSRS